MNRSIVFLIICLLSTVFLAGCHEPTPGDDIGDDGDDTGTDGGDERQQIGLMVTDAPDTVAVGESFNVTVNVSSDGTVTSSHFGAHWSFNSTAGRDDLAPADFDGASPHVTEETQIGDSYTIMAWTFGAEHVGMIYYRAHVQTAQGDYWSDEQTINVNAA